MLYKTFIVSGIGALLVGVSGVALAQSAPVTMEEAIATAVESNPQIAQAQYNTEAIQFERKQAQGLFLPTLDMEAYAGIRRLENPTRDTLGISDDVLYPRGVEGRFDWKVIDFGRRRGELLRQAARVDGASLRVVERSEFIALQVARQYLNILLQQRVLAASMDNVTFHQAMVGDLGTGVQQGSISIADQQQAQERLQAALVRQTEAEQSLEDAKITLRTLTGLDIEAVQMPATYVESLPASADEAIGLARTNNPKVMEAKADVDAAHAMIDKAKGDLYPTIGIDGVGRYGEDIDGFRGITSDLQARVYLKWNLFNGGITRNNIQEMVRRASESRYRLYEVTRAAEEDVRIAWNAIRAQAKVTADLTTQSRVSDDLLLSYRSQFNVGRRSLLDVLDAQNSRYNVQVRLETARFSQQFAQYQALAATNRFLTAIHQAPAAGSGMAERERFNYGPPKPAELEYRRVP
jgi:outer membrane protein, adhesin transport system